MRRNCSTGCGRATCGPLKSSSPPISTASSAWCLNRLASGDRRAVRGGEEVLLRVADERGGPEVQAERGELEAALHRAIAELPEERRVVIILRDLEGLSYEEIARALDLEPGTVRSRIHRARMDLRGKLERFLP